MIEDARSLESLFSVLHPRTSAYEEPLSAELSDCFDWIATFKQHRVEKRLKVYIVAFRSVRSIAADDPLLYAADEAAYSEAKKSGGLLKYWYGTLNKRRECLSMCIWESKEAAGRAFSKPAHTAAVQLAASMYDRYTFERFWLELAPSTGGILYSFKRIDSRSACTAESNS